MLKYIVLWTVLQSFSVPCPQPQPFTDEYGVYHPVTAITLQACSESKTTPMSKEFTSLEEAEKFIEEGKKRSRPYDAQFIGWEIREEVGP